VAVIELTESNFEETINKNALVFIDFWASWCGPCKSFAPTYEKFATLHPDVVCAKVNTEEQQGLAQSFQIRSIPTIMIFKEQVVIFSQAGSLPESALEEVYTKAKELDMDEVRKQIADEEAKKNANA